MGARGNRERGNAERGRGRQGHGAGGTESQNKTDTPDSACVPPPPPIQIYQNVNSFSVFASERGFKGPKPPKIG